MLARWLGRPGEGPPSEEGMPFSHTTHGEPMALPSRESPIDYHTLAELLNSLGSPVRLELLDRLRFPHTLSEIKLSPHRRDPGRNPGRPAARQTIQVHVDRLLATKLVHADRSSAGGRSAPTYVVNSLRLYELLEELRRLSVRHAGRGPTSDATGTLAGLPAPGATAGPRLVLVHGVYEGKAFPLDDESSQEGQWTIGRRAGLAVVLDYDPFISLRNSVVAEDEQGYVLRDLGSKNGTSVNWVPLPANGSARLRSGDVIGVGRSLLVFIPE